MSTDLDEGIDGIGALEIHDPEGLLANLVEDAYNSPYLVIFKDPNSGEIEISMFADLESAEQFTTRNCKAGVPRVVILEVNQVREGSTNTEGRLQITTTYMKPNFDDEF